MVEKKLFGYPTFDENGEEILSTYDNEYRDMLMDVRLYRMAAGSTREFCREGEEIAVLLLSGEITFKWAEGEKTVSRKDVFTEGPWALHVSGGKQITVTAVKDAEILVQCTQNEKDFASRLYAPEDAPWAYSGAKGKFGDTANRQVNTIFDHDICPESNMVLDFKFDRPEGFGASFVGDDVFKSVDNSFSAIPGGKLHPQSAAPGYLMYTCWMIRHLPGNPWLQTDRCEDDAYVWLHDAKIVNQPW